MDARAGFSLFEVLLALAVAGLVAAVAVPNAVKTMESSEDRRAVFHFTRLMLDLRSSAFRDEVDISVVNTGDFHDDPDADPRPAEIVLDNGWSYQLERPLAISARGLCDPVAVTLSYNGAARLNLHGAPDCSFTWERVR